MPTRESNDGEWVYEITSEEQRDSIKKKLLKRFSWMNDEEREEIIESIDNLPIQDEKEENSTEGGKSARESNQKNQSESQNTSQDSASEKPNLDTENLEQLKRDAEDSAREEIGKGELSRDYRAQEYIRSTAVKKYVKARAKGQCEGCGNSAPFQNTNNQPYLHAHHVHELSQGGSDTPETVIALCPNCHYRVHHGKDGDEYNENLMTRLSEIEDVPISEIRTKGG